MNLNCVELILAFLDFIANYNYHLYRLPYWFKSGSLTLHCYYFGEFAAIDLPRLCLKFIFIFLSLSERCAKLVSTRSQYLSIKILKYLFCDCRLINVPASQKYGCTMTNQLEDRREKLLLLMMMQMLPVQLLIGLMVRQKSNL